MTVEPTAAEQIDRMRSLARDIWGDAFTLKVTLWEDGDYRLVAYHRDHDDTDLGQRYEELWHQSGKTPHDQALYVVTRQHQEGEPVWHADEGDDETEPELRDLPP